MGGSISKRWVGQFPSVAYTIDYLLSRQDLFGDPSVVWEFIGGEPFLEIDLMDQITDYAKLRMYELRHPWFDSYRFSISTNGLLYGDVRVQEYIAKNHAHLSIGITIDGTRAKHDQQRVFPDGRGSYDDVARNIPLWLSQFPGGSTKATIAHRDLPHVKDSVLHLWGLGIKAVNMNVVFEDVWEEGDDEILEHQLNDLADEAIRGGWYREHTVSFFVDSIGKPMDPRTDNQNWCGAGKMLAVDADGDFYPCVRFAPYSLSRRKAIVVGNCVDGLDLNRLRPFIALDRVTQSPPECIACEVATGCAWCSGHNYDSSATGTVFERSTTICKMHKARVRANSYYMSLVAAVDSGFSAPTGVECSG